VGGVRRRLARIEERHAAARPRKRSAAERRSEWEARRRISYNEHRPYSVFRARDFIDHRRLIGWLSRYSAENLIDAILFGDPRLGTRGETTELSRPMVEATVFRAIFDEEDGMAHMQAELPGPWREAFQAADEWRERLLSVPTAEVAVWVRAHRTLIKERATADEMLALALKTVGPYGITEEVLERVCGPDRDLLSGQEAHWLLYLPVSGVLRSDWAWHVREQVRKLDASLGR
jgi:hypothetical protein